MEKPIFALAQEICARCEDFGGGAAATIALASMWN